MQNKSKEIQKWWEIRRFLEKINDKKALETCMQNG